MKRSRRDLIVTVEDDEVLGDDHDLEFNGFDEPLAFEAGLVSQQRHRDSDEDEEGDEVEEKPRVVAVIPLADHEVPESFSLAREIAKMRERLGLFGVPLEADNGTDRKLELGDVEPAEDEDGDEAPEGFFDRSAHSLKVCDELVFVFVVVFSLCCSSVSRQFSRAGSESAAAADSNELRMEQAVRGTIRRGSSGPGGARSVCFCRHGLGQDGRLCASRRGAAAAASSRQRCSRARAGAGAYQRAGGAVRGSVRTAHEGNGPQSGRRSGRSRDQDTGWLFVVVGLHLLFFFFFSRRRCFASVRTWWLRLRAVSWTCC
jgi:hypothetical protein